MTLTSWERAPSITLEPVKLTHKENPYNMTNLSNKDILGSALVPIAHSDNGIEYLIDGTLHEFNNSITKLKIENETKFLKFGNCLKGAYKNDWEQVLLDNFLIATSSSYDASKHDRSKNATFTNAVHSFIKKVLDNFFPKSD